MTNRRARKNHEQIGKSQWKTRKTKENSGKPRKMKGKPLQTKIQKIFPKRKNIIPQTIFYPLYNISLKATSQIGNWAPKCQDSIYQKLNLQPGHMLLGMETFSAALAWLFTFVTGDILEAIRPLALKVLLLRSKLKTPGEDSSEEVLGTLHTSISSSKTSSKCKCILFA